MKFKSFAQLLCTSNIRSRGSTKAVQVQRDNVFYSVYYSRRPEKPYETGRLQMTTAIVGVDRRDKGAYRLNSYADERMLRRVVELACKSLSKRIRGIG